MTLQEAQERTDQWIREHGVRYFSELTNLALLMEEVGEMARVMARRFGEQSVREGTDPGSLEEEMADVLFVLFCLANQTNIDLTEAFEKTLAKKTQRDANRHKANPKLNQK